MSEGTVRSSQGLQMNRAKLRDLAFWGLMGLIVMAFVAWQWAPAHEFDWRYDEGLDAMKARLVLDGYSLYRDIWSDQPPLLTLLLATAFAVFGQSVLVGRVLVLLLSGLGLLAMGRIGRHLAGRPAALVMVVFMALMPHFHDLSRAILLSLPAIGVGLTALAAGFVYQSTGRPHWIAVSALLFGLGLLIKPVIAPLYLPLSALALLGTRHHRATPRERIRRWAVFSTAVAAPLFLTVVLSHPRAFLGQVVGTFTQTREACGFSLAENVAMVREYLLDADWGVCHAGLLSLAAVGLLSLAVRRRWYHLVPMGLWLAAVLLAVLFYWQLREHQLFLLMPSLAACAGIGVGQAATGLVASRRATATQRLLTLAGLVCVIATSCSVPLMVRQDFALWGASLAQRTSSKWLACRDVIRFLRSHAPLNSTIITDGVMLAFKAGHLVPPMLAVPSNRRLTAGKLDPNLLIGITEKARPGAIVFWEDRLELVTEYVDWVSANYCCVIGSDSVSKRVYIPCSHLVPLGAQLAAQFDLVGWDIDSDLARPGEAVTLTLYWRALAHTDADYHVFVHVGEHDPVARVDSAPRCGEHPTYRWQVGEQVVDRHLLIVREDAAPGVLTVWVGMYDVGTRHRLPVTDAGGSPVGDSLQLTQVRVGEPDYDAPSPGHPRNVTLGESVRLLGHDLSSAAAGPGDTVKVTLYWECLTPMETGYSVFVHLLGPDGKIYGQQDSVPWGGRLPTTHWVTGEVITDEYAVPVSQDAPAGAYTLLVGMYDLQTGMRLAAVDGDGTLLANNSVSLGQVTIHE